MFRSQSSDHHQGSITVLVQVATYRRACLVVFRCVAVCCLCIRCTCPCGEFPWYNKLSCDSE